MNASNPSNSASQNCYDLREVPEYLLALHATVIAVIILATLVGNALLVLLVARYKVLRSHSMIASLSLTLADVLWGMSYHFPALVSASYLDWPFGQDGCTAFSFLNFEFLVTRWLMMAVICIDRFSTVRFPFSYEKHSKYVIIVLTTAAWILPVVLAIIPILAKFSRETFRPNVPTCLFGCEDSNVLCRMYYGLAVTLSFIIGAIIPTILYVWLYRRARRLRQSTVLGHLTSTLHTTSGPVVRQSIANSSPPVGLSREIQGYITFVLILVTIVITALPAYISQIFRTLAFESWCKIPIVVHFIIQLIFFSSTALDPLVIMRDRDFRLCLKDLFCCKRRRDLHVVSPAPATRTVESQGDLTSLPSVYLNGSKAELSSGLSPESQSSDSMDSPVALLGLSRMPDPGWSPTNTSQSIVIVHINSFFIGAFFELAQKNLFVVFYLTVPINYFYYWLIPIATYTDYVIKIE